MLLKSILLFLFLLSCSKENNKKEITNLPQPIPGISGIQKVDDYPLYIMKYSGDYHFDDYLRTGTYPALAQNRTISNSRSAWGCTCFAGMGKVETTFFGRNFDWHECIPLLLITEPENGYSSISMVDLEYLGFNKDNLPDNSSTNQRLCSAPYLPFDGMNEKGVTIGMMAIESASCNTNPSKVTIGELEVIRLVLDYAANVDEAIQLIGSYNVQFTNPPIHYMLADKAGKSAIVEFVNGEMKVIRNTSPWLVCTNFIITGSSAPNSSSCWRYNSVQSNLSEKQGILNLTEATNLIQDVSQSNTIWSMVYDNSNAIAYVSVNRKFSKWMKYQLNP